MASPDLVMARYIYCVECGDDWKLHPQDAGLGYTSRKVYVSIIKPDGHGITDDGVFTPLPEVVCDKCGVVVTGEVAVAISMIPPEREMREWEYEYGTVLNDEALAAYRLLSGKEKDRY